MFELTAHFRLHLAVFLSVITVVWLMKRHYRLAVICSVAAVVNLALVMLLLWPEGKTVPRSGSPLKLVAINVYTKNARSDLVLEFLHRTDADVILLMEVNARWMRALETLHTEYPHGVVQPREDNFGIALFSRLPITKGQVIQLGRAEVPSISATVEVDGQSVFLLGTHSLPPGSADYARLRNEQFKEIAARIRLEAMPAIVLGDLNATPWSPYFEDLLRESGLENTSQGRGLFGSWPAGWPLGRIPLDHCLVSPTVQLNEKYVGTPVGSDHLPVVVKVQLP